MPKVARSAIYLYTQGLIATGSGYLFWIIISRITSAEILGLASATSAVAAVAISIATIGIPSGVRRFLGKATAENDSNLFRNYFTASLRLVGISVSIVALPFIFLAGPLSNTINLPFEFVLMSLVIFTTTAFSRVRVSL